MAPTASEKICETMKKLIEEGKYTEAAQTGEKLAIENFEDNLNATFFAMLALAHTGAGSFPAARLAAVRGVAETGDKSLDFLSRLLQSRSNGNYAEAIGSLKSAPEDVVGMFRDVLLLELAMTTARMENPAKIDHVVAMSKESEEVVKAALSKKGKFFGVQLNGDGSLSRVKKEFGGKQDTKKQEIASIELVTEAALMTAKNVDRYWN